MALSATGCASASTYASLDIAGSTLSVSAVNAPVSSPNSVGVTVALRTAAGAPIAHAPVVVAADGCTVMQASTSTDANGMLQASLVSSAVGQHTVTATLQLSNFNQTLYNQATINFYPGRPDGIPVATALNFVIQAQRDYVGTVRFESTDPQASLPAAYAFGAQDHGQHQWLASFVLRTAGAQTVRAVDAQTGALLATGDFIMSPGDSAELVLDVPTTTLAGAPLSITVSARDGFGNVATRSAPTLTLDTSDAAATLPALLQLQSSDAGVQAASLVLRTAGLQTLRVTDGTVSSGWTNVLVRPQAAAALRVSGIANGRAGSSASVTVAAVDEFGNVVPSYVGAISFASSDTAASLPQSARLTSADAGTHTWPQSVALAGAGLQWVSATDGVLSGRQTNIQVSASAAVALRTNTVGDATAGVPVDCTVQAIDSYGNLDPAYTGQFVPSSSDALAVLPGPRAFAAADHGAVTFAAGCLFKTAGAQTFDASDAARALARGSSTVAVLGNNAVRMQVSGLTTPSSWSIPQTLTVTLLDTYGNPAQYAGTVGLQSQDANAVLGAAHTYTAADHGSAQFAVTLASLGTFAVTAQDTQNSALQGNMVVRVRRVEAVNALADNHVCALLDGGEVKCWGSNAGGELGTGDGKPRGLGAGQMGAALPSVPMGTGRTAVSVGAGSGDSCVLLDTQQVKCWGLNSRGALGLGDSADRGINSSALGDALPTVNLGTGRSVLALGSGDHACALLDNHQIKCWGHNDSGECGADGYSDIGGSPGNMGDNLGTVSLGTGRSAVQVATGTRYTCAVLDNGQVQCWGQWSAVSNTTFSGVTAVQVHQGGTDLCVLLSDGSVVCSVDGRGTGLSGTPLPTIALGTGRTATHFATGVDNVCAVLDNGQLKCWGNNFYGQLGLGDTLTRRDAATLGDALPAIDLGTGRTALAVTAGNEFTCALLDTHQVKCWGYNGYGVLGLGDTVQRGSSAGQMGDALGVVPLW